MKCPVCHEEVINIYKVGWAHKDFNTCNLSDGLNLVRIVTDSGFELFYYDLKDMQAREFFVKKFNELEKEALQNASKPPLNGNTGTIKENSIVAVKPQNTQKREFLRVFEPFYE